MATVDDDPSATPKRPATGWAAWLADPRTAVLGFLASALLFGGGRKVWQGVRARRAVAALGAVDVRPSEVLAAAEHGREGLIELFRLLGTAEGPEVRDAAGRALAMIWGRDDLIVEEEKALVRRGFAVSWKARRRYPRGLRRAIPIEVHYGVPFLAVDKTGDRPEVTAADLEWSHRVLGTERAGLLEPSPWTRGTGLARFELEPTDFATLGPHRLALAASVRVVGLTDNWELELPHLPFSFEFDPILAVEAMMTTEDGPRAEAFARAIGLVEPRNVPEYAPGPLDLTPDLVLRDPPALSVATPLPCDLAHRLEIEIEGVPGRYRAGSVVVVGDRGAKGSVAADAGLPYFPPGPILGLPADAVDRPGDRRIRYVLTADPELGWGDPDVRSVWPGPLATDWATVRVIRR